MELDPLLLRGVHALLFLGFHHVAHGNAQVPGVVVIQAFAPDLDAHAFLDPVHLLLDRRALFVGNRRCRRFFLFHEATPVAEEDLAKHRTGIVGYREGHQQHFAALQFLLFQLEDLALHNHQAAFAVQLPDFHRSVRHAPADDRFAEGLGFRIHRQQFHLRFFGLSFLFNRFLFSGRFLRRGFLFAGNPGSVPFRHFRRRHG